MTTFEAKQDAPKARPALHKMSWAWLGLLPFLIFALLFLALPSSTIFIRSFQNATTHAFTFKNIVSLLSNHYILNAYWISIKISLVTSISGAIFGFLLAYSAIRGGLPGFVRS